ncbi:MAG: histidine triad nucleotide-binding protein [Gammaproteobacteria bacterium RIFCSPLOWO2_02_FULL_42_14]|nr:MAG: histidine triad nucleotide-binding protein [Gammaproteobacteria bacterium RIFCSPHIGHO2_02_FULL_42_43]OGT50799.1 MAG: histidine triad nucleotide-binding protein [Gammaproteobacteria bacterium RIFCSPHIGHO2_12_FULL_41_25]OGT61783.1 MAG: histidine triad nucleotide-binding protein [Gammaproteobacteria bacterium RIFCSPLOWO2_02_FULL_42_14]OGT85528.1 MAG: histidine triad nucleotide-binding protein [Gammaproteobacteria bacterium RIFCSPLOWO2_12_FULL_42_18]
MDCLFCNIVAGKMNTSFIYEDDQVVAFNDIAPKAPQHVLIIPRKHIATINDITETDNLLLAHLIQTAKTLAKKLAIDESGYRLLFNCNPNGGQMVYHLHLHLLGGRKLNWPPG